MGRCWAEPDKSLRRRTAAALDPFVAHASTAGVHSSEQSGRRTSSVLEQGIRAERLHIPTVPGRSAYPISEASFACIACCSLCAASTSCIFLWLIERRFSKASGTNQTTNTARLCSEAGASMR